MKLVTLLPGDKDPDAAIAATRPRFVMVCGSRDWASYATVRDGLGQFIDQGVSIMHGGAKGADTLAGEACRELGLSSYVFPPDYDLFGKDAPHVRNDAMLKQADRVLAFWDGASRGTKSVIDKARKLGVPVEVIT